MSSSIAIVILDSSGTNPSGTCRTGRVTPSDANVFTFRSL
jgi:hypothetical protein